VNTQIHIRTTSGLKSELQKAAEEMGVSISFILNKLLRKFLKTKAKTHTHVKYVPNARLLKSMERAKKSYKEGKDSPTFNTGEEAVKWLHEQGI